MSIKYLITNKNKTVVMLANPDNKNIQDLYPHDEFTTDALGSDEIECDCLTDDGKDYLLYNGRRFLISYTNVTITQGNNSRSRFKKEETFVNISEHYFYMNNNDGYLNLQEVGFIKDRRILEEILINRSVFGFSDPSALELTEHEDKTSKRHFITIRNPLLSTDYDEYGTAISVDNEVCLSLVKDIYPLMWGGNTHIYTFGKEYNEKTGKIKIAFERDTHDCKGMIFTIKYNYEDLENPNFDGGSLELSDETIDVNSGINFISNEQLQNYYEGGMIISNQYILSTYDALILNHGLSLKAEKVKKVTTETVLKSIRNFLEENNSYGGYIPLDSVMLKLDDLLRINPDCLTENDKRLITNRTLKSKKYRGCCKEKGWNDDSVLNEINSYVKETIQELRNLPDDNMTDVIIDLDNKDLLSGEIILEITKKFLENANGHNYTNKPISNILTKGQIIIQLNKLLQEQKIDTLINYVNGFLTGDNSFRLPDDLAKNLTRYLMKGMEIETSCKLYNDRHFLTECAKENINYFLKERQFDNATKTAELMRIKIPILYESTFKEAVREYLTSGLFFKYKELINNQEWLTFEPFDLNQALRSIPAEYYINMIVNAVQTSSLKQDDLFKLIQKTPQEIIIELIRHDKINTARDVMNSENQPVINLPEDLFTDTATRLFKEGRIDDLELLLKLTNQEMPEIKEEIIKYRIEKTKESGFIDELPRLQIVNKAL